MSDDKADNNPAPEEETATISSQEAQPSSEPAPPQAETADNKLGGLMADTPAAEAAPAKPAVDLEAEAMRAAEDALAEGEKALAQAQSELLQQQAPKPAAKPASNKRREMVLRVLLAVNILAMVVVSMMPTTGDQPTDTGGGTPVVTPPVNDTVKPNPMSDPVNRAMQLAQNRDFAGAVIVLESYLSATPLMHSAERLSVLLALSSYAARNLDFDKSRKYAQQAQSLEQSHYLPDDLVKMAEAALASGDQESLRRTWARFLLQQRQIPSWLYQHVAQAYLQLGDSYRTDADTAAEAARLIELKAQAARVRAEALQGDK